MKNNLRCGRVFWRTDGGGNPTVAVQLSLQCWNCRVSPAAYLASLSIGRVQTCILCLKQAQLAERKWKQDAPSRKLTEARERNYQFAFRRAKVQGGGGGNGTGRSAR